MKALSKAKEIIVDVYSDIACPWCYVGKRKFILAKQQFLKDFPDAKVKINFHAYIIDGATKKMGEEYMAYNVRRWGSDGWTHSLRAAGKKVGCNFANWKTWPNTSLAHCLIAEASKKEIGEDVLEEIFKKCYEEGQNISDPTVLDEIGKKYGISEWKTKENMQSVEHDDKKGKHELGIEGVPYFIFANKEVLEGAQDQSTFYDAFISFNK